MDKQHKLLMRSVLEYVLAPNPLVKVDGIYGQNERGRFHARVWVDARYPDLPLRWRELTFPAPADGTPDMEILCLPGLWTPATVPGSDGRKRTTFEGQQAQGNQGARSSPFTVASRLG